MMKKYDLKSNIQLIIHLSNVFKILKSSIETKSKSKL